MTVITRVNQLELRLVNDGPELEAAQALRYQVFYGEMGAHASAEMRACGRDFDRYDAIADHLVVVDLDRSSGFRPWVAGCYRVLRGPVAARHGGFYTANEFDLGGVAVPRDEVMELGRSCVHAEYRGGPAMQLLWRGIAGYVEAYGVGLMLGCASLAGHGRRRARRGAELPPPPPPGPARGSGRAPCRAASSPPTGCRRIRSM